MHDGSVRCFSPGSLIRINEWYGWNGKPNEGSRLLSQMVGRMIIEREQSMGYAGRVVPGPADSSIFDTQDGNCIAEQFRMVGVRWLKANKGPGSRIHGWEQMAAMFANAITGEGAGLYVTELCRQFIRTVPVLPRSESNPDDIDTDAEDHVADESRYMVLHKLRVASQGDMY
jgi:hypothetical protein